MFKLPQPTTSTCSVCGLSHTTICPMLLTSWPFVISDYAVPTNDSRFVIQQRDGRWHFHNPFRRYLGQLDAEPISEVKGKCLLLRQSPAMLQPYYQNKSVDVWAIFLGYIQIEEIFRISLEKVNEHDMVLFQRGQAYYLISNRFNAHHGLLKVS